MALSITREQFSDVYSGTTVAQYVDLFYTDPSSDVELLRDFMTSKLWRLNNLYTIVNKFGKKVRFKMNLSQHKVYAASLKHPRLIILKSRQQGISTLWLVSFFDDAIVNSNFSIGLMAQGQDESSTLLERVKILWENLDPNVKAFFGVSTNRDNTKEFSLTNGSNLFIRTSFRSATLQRLHISEMGKIANRYPEKAQETKTGTLQAIAPGNTAVIESTAEGDNMFKDMWDNSIKYFDSQSTGDFMPVFLSWLDDPDCANRTDQVVGKKASDYFGELEHQLGRFLTQEQKNFWVVKHRELGDKIYQEYPSTPVEAFMASKEGNYYAKLYLEHVKQGNREVRDLYDKNLDVQVAVDLGMDDTNVIGVFQTYRDEVRMIDEFVDNGQRISYYTDHLKAQPYAENITLIVLPHDGEVRELTSGKTRTEVFEEEMPDANVVVLPKAADGVAVNEGIEQVRQLIGMLWVDTDRCPYTVECMYNYTKQWNEKLERWRDKPHHDEFSNGADMLRAAAIGIERDSRPRTDRRRTRRVRGHDV